MNNKLKAICLGLIFFIAVTQQSDAQTTINANGDVVTKQDAVDFINKVMKEFPRTPAANSGNDSFWDFKETALLEGSTLIVKKSYNESRYGGGYNNEQDSIAFNLSSSSYEPDYPNLVGYASYKLTSYKKNGKLDVKETEGNKILGFTHAGAFTEANIYFLVNNLAQEFRDKDYEHRFPKAFIFLIQACGGSKTKAEPKDKF